ncbi:hypothetical protein BASA83_006633 [Batrachochytrium salamandrivorans]|nr:hypothetical protein BASA83_006633 [Batrachochytrium salamandrivorans]
MVDLLLVQQVPVQSPFLTGRDSLRDCLQCGYVKTGCLNPNLGRLNSGCLEGLATNRCKQRSKEVPGFDIRTALDGRDRLYSNDEIAASLSFSAASERGTQALKDLTIVASRLVIIRVKADT